MKKNFKEEKAITLIALTITVIILLILTGVGIGVNNGIKKNIKESKSATASSDIVKVQQAVIEAYITYKQTSNKKVLIGEEIQYSEAQAIATEFNNLKDGDPEISLKQEESSDPDKCYYKLDKTHLKKMGMLKLQEDDEYIVNYSTGEVFNITGKQAADGSILYVYAK